LEKRSFYGVLNHDYTFFSSHFELVTSNVNFDTSNVINKSHIMQNTKIRSK